MKQAHEGRSLAGNCRRDPIIRATLLSMVVEVVWQQYVAHAVPARNARNQVERVVRSVAVEHRSVAVIVNHHVTAAAKYDRKCNPQWNDPAWNCNKVRRKEQGHRNQHRGSRTCVSRMSQPEHLSFNSEEASP